MLNNWVKLVKKILFLNLRLELWIFRCVNLSKCWKIKDNLNRKHSIYSIHLDFLRSHIKIRVLPIRYPTKNKISKRNKDMPSPSSKCRPKVLNLISTDHHHQSNNVSVTNSREMNLK